MKNLVIEQLFVTPEHSIRQVTACLDKNSSGIALIVDEKQQLVDTITDGDIRRAILDGISLDEPVKVLQSRRQHSPYPQPIVAQVGVDYHSLLTLMQEKKIRHVPIVDSTGKVVDVCTLEELIPDDIPPMEAVVMAGGFGSRLRPLTENLPKPMLPVGNRPLLEHTLEQLQQAGIKQVNITTHYLPEKITDYFGDGRDFDIEIRYVHEEKPLGTGGALGLLDTPQQPILVMNGDILTRLDFKAMLKFHQKHQADLTVGVRQYDLQVPYGVIECDGHQIKQIREKPTVNFLVNTGIYLLEPSSHQYIPTNQRFDMTDLIQALLDDGRSVVSFPIIEYWLDIGQIPDYQRAQNDIQLFS